MIKFHGKTTVVIKATFNDRILNNRLEEIISKAIDNAPAIMSTSVRIRETLVSQLRYRCCYYIPNILRARYDTLLPVAERRKFKLAIIKGILITTGGGILIKVFILIVDRFLVK